MVEISNPLLLPENIGSKDPCAGVAVWPELVETAVFHCADACPGACAFGSDSLASQASRRTAGLQLGTTTCYCESLGMAVDGPTNSFLDLDVGIVIYEQVFPGLHVRRCMRLLGNSEYEQLREADTAISSLELLTSFQCKDLFDESNWVIGAFLEGKTELSPQVQIVDCVG